MSTNPRIKPTGKVLLFLGQDFLFPFIQWGMLSGRNFSEANIPTNPLIIVRANLPTYVLIARQQDNTYINVLRGP